ncbi:MAG: hypothetical protein LC105_05895 [Chitinophagales bacterium]|nr:hypothetical protein [Chitinophagales bacterium]MCZ2393366.1 hypothetical protein [Chitinophagales bacterium]
MYKLFVIVFSLFSSTCLIAQSFSIQNSSAIEVTDKYSYPIQLISVDSHNIVISKGSSTLLTKEYEIYSKSLKSTQKVKLKTSPYEKADYALWTGKLLILLWEKKVKNDNSISYQIVSKNGRTSTKSNLGIIENGQSSFLKNHQIEIIKSIDNEYFAFIIKDIITKKENQYIEFLAIFNKEGKLIEKQKNKYADFVAFDGFHFLSNDSLYIKISKNKNQLQVYQKNIIEKEQNKFSLPIEIPDSIIIGPYNIIYNPQNSGYSFSASLKNNAQTIGYNGEIFIQFDIDEQKQKSLWVNFYTAEFLEEFKKSDSISGGYILNNDFSLNTQFKIRKTLLNKDGGYYLIREYYPTIPLSIKKEQYASKIDKTLDINGQINSPYNMLDLIITKISNQGEIEWVKRIPKAQFGLGYQYGSFDAFLNKKEELVILYNMELSNKSFLKKIDNNYINNMNISPLAKTFTPNGEVSTYPLSKWLGNDMTLFPLFSIGFNSENEELLTITQEKSKSKPKLWKLTKIGFQ